MTNEINKAILHQVARDVREGNLKFPQALGFSSNELKKLESLTQEELAHLFCTSVPFIHIQINHDIFRRLIAEATEESRKQKLIDRALILGASIEIMANYFALTSSQVSARRKILGIESVQGRIRRASEEEENIIWLEWKKYADTILHLNTIAALDTLMMMTEQLNSQQKNSLITLPIVFCLVTEWLAR